VRPSWLLLATEMIVSKVRHRCGADTCELAAEVRSEAWSEERFTLWYRVPATLAADHDPVAPDCSPFLAGLLLWCLRRSERLVIEGPVSGRLLDAVALINDIGKAFWPEFGMTRVEATRHTPARASGPVMSFFTRGVDSWYTALTHGERPYDGPALTHLVYVPSVDFMFDDANLAATIAHTRAAAERAGFETVTVETNLRRNTEHFLHWGYYHGAGLASIGLAMRSPRVLVPAGRSYGFIVPEGTHPLLDPLWSTERTEIVHHGAEATRFAKVRRLAREPQALGSLKVCFDANTLGNCGRCPKCLVTMTMLRAAGVVDHSSFDTPLDPRAVARLDVPPALLELLRVEVLPHVDDASLALALRWAVARVSTQTAWKSARDLVSSAMSALRTRKGGRAMISPSSSP